jgi:ABC-2 type transport system ATP-binding protein
MTTDTSGSAKAQPPMIEIDGLRKVYGQYEAVKGISFSVRRGEILGFLGPNGAGKSTTMKVMTGLIPPTSGRVVMAGHDVLEDPMGMRRAIGYLPEVPPLYPEMVVRDYLTFCAEIRAVGRLQRGRAVDQAIERCGLTEVAQRLVGNLSKGYRQRVGLAQAVIHEPRILILDEPTVGLDPTQVFAIRRIVRDLGKDRTVVLCSHILPEVQETCHTVVIINRGLLVAQGPMDALLHRSGRGRLLIRTLSSVTDPTELLRFGSVVEVGATGDGRWRVDLEGDAAARARYLSALAQSPLGLLEASPESTSLEQVFREVVTEEAKA